MENVKDWCISRQLWWGQRIPAWYYGAHPGPNDYVVALTKEEALEEAMRVTGNRSLTEADLRQDEDVLDTWFSSWLWPISVFDGIRNPDNGDMSYYYPTNDLVTAPEILFFWVARMIIAGYEYQGEKPFSNVYLTGIVRDSQRRKMSKSLGNSPDPIELMKKYSADGVRVGMLLCSPAGNDLLFDEGLTEQGRNFSNKIWNAFRLVNSWEVNPDIEQPESSIKAIEWFESRLNRGLAEIEDQFKKYRLSEALMVTYKLFWDEFSSWYLETIKPGYQQPVDRRTKSATLLFFDKLLRILHPFMPFITEELWHLLESREKGQSLMIAELPRRGKVDKKLLMEFDITREIISQIRNIRRDKNLGKNDELKLLVRNTSVGDFPSGLESVVLKMGMISEIIHTEEEVEGAVSFIVKNVEYYLPLGGLVDVEEEISRMEKELEYTRGFLVSVMKKLGNEKFVSSAPESVVGAERKKLADAEAKIRTLEEQIASLRK
jgi:valyl-tRNA synthetase